MGLRPNATAAKFGIDSGDESEQTEEELRPRSPIQEMESDANNEGVEKANADNSMVNDAERGQEVVETNTGGASTSEPIAIKRRKKETQ